LSILDNKFASIQIDISNKMELGTPVYLIYEFLNYAGGKSPKIVARIQMNTTKWFQPLEFNSTAQTKCLQAQFRKH